MKLTDNGYLIFPNTVPLDLCQTVVRDIMTHTRSGKVGIGPSGMVEMYHYQSMWDVRQHPAVHKVFADLFGTEKLWVSIDRASYKPPWKDVWDKENLAQNTEGFVHWDENPNRKPRPFAVQGLVALTDTTTDMGGFQCVPNLYRELDTWLASLPTKKAVFSHFELFQKHAYEVIPQGWQEFWGPRHSWPIEKVALKAGDLLVWDSYLPHGNGVNCDLERTRLAQYVTMTLPGDERESYERDGCWFCNEPPTGWAFPGDPRRIEQEKTEPARLTELGFRLLGVSKWT